MSSRKLVDGFKAMGFALGFGESEVPANFEVRDGKAELTVLQPSEDPVKLFSDEKDEIPSLVLFLSTEVNLNLSKLHVSRQKSELFSGVRTKTFGVGRVVRTPEDIDHNQVHGMISELEGFDRWAEQQSISQKLILSNQQGEPPVAVLKAEAQKPTLLGSSFNVQANAGYLLPSHATYSTSYTIHNVASLRSQTADLKSWDEHQQVHRMIQDLVCLAYGYPCSIRLKKILRTDNQPYLPEDSQETSGKYYWHEAFENNFGRSRDVKPRKEIEDFDPLFRLSDTHLDDMENWIENFDKWSRPTWIAVESIFQPHLAAESRMLLIGSAMEALGYAIWLYDEHGGVMPPGRKPSAPRYFERVAKTLPWGDLEIAGQSTPEKWAESFNTVYKGCKHADNPLPDGVKAFDCAQEGLMVIRCWIAKKLGVSDEILIKNKNSL